MYELLGVAGLKLGYLGSVGYLEAQQRQAVITWLQTKNWNLAELQGYVQQEYDVVFDSKQSYYSLFEEAGISWKKQKRNQKRPRTGQKKDKRLQTG